MEFIRSGSVIVDKKTKLFDDGYGEGVRYIFDAAIYNEPQYAQEELETNFDEPENFEIWDIEVYRVR